MYRENGKEHGNYRDYKGYMGIVLGLYWGYVASNAIGVIGYILG